MVGVTQKGRDTRLRHVGSRKPRSMQRSELATDLDAGTLRTMINQSLQEISGSYLPLSGGTMTGDITLGGGDNIVLNLATGTKIGTATSQLLGFYGVTPVNQPATVGDATGGATVDAEARVAVNALIDRLQELGLIA